MENKIESEFVRSTDVFGYRAFAGFEYSGVYSIKCVVNNKQYVGASRHITRRLSKHFSELHLNRHANTRLQNDYNKYGYENFVYSCIEACDEEVLLEREKFYQIKIGMDNIYNDKISGYWCSEEYSNKHRYSNKDKHKTDEYREKMRKIKSHRICKFVRIPVIEEGITIDKEIETYECMRDVLDANPSYKRSVINSCCNGWKKTAYGFNWKYVDKNGNQVIGYKKQDKI